MAEVLELEKVETEQKSKSGGIEKDTWILKLPSEVCRREGFAEGTMISLTMRNARVQTSIIRPSVEIDDFVNRIINEEKEYFEEIKLIGD